ncbi:extracellular solute-binding protein [Paenibacillus aurantius]|uniref:Extracellular solute-binding protein n=1 Tax=Paenibacillus aurantius TaxID=2918900 RepID=A0AA96LBD6_9BACL|nr:extracellular solute-binding protein [Paenibacillus aurantius]WNQ10522.1 extracellular solute-binding protein [Paenibacillus aurantius]
MKKSLSVLLAIILASFTILAACGKQDSQSGGSGGGENGGPVSMTFFAPQGKAPMEENEFTKFIEKKFNVKLKWDLAPSDALQDRRQLLLASGDYPEVFLHGKFTTSDLQNYGKQGVFLPLNDLLAKYAPNITKQMEDKPYFKDAITAPDGNIYALPIFNECYHCTYSQKYWINKEWLDKLGLKMPTTTDELYTVLKAFKTKDPNGNGKADEIPLTGAPNKYVWNGNIDAFLMNSFIYNDNDKYLIVKDGKISFAANQPEWKQGLEYMNKLYKEGLVDPASFTQNDQAVGQLGNKEGDEAVGSITTALISYLVNTYEKDKTRHQHWEIVPPLKGPNGVQTTGASQSVGEFEFAITNKASEAQQIAAIKIADYMFSEEGALYAEYGPTEGKGWKKAEPDEKNIDGKPAKYSYYNLPERDKNVIVNESWSQIGAHDLSKTFRDLFAEGQDPMTPEGYGTRLAKATQVYQPYAPKETYPANVFIRTEDTENAAQLTTAIKDYVVSNMAQFIIGSKSIDKDWDAYVKGFDGLNLKEYLAIYQRALEKKEK